MNVKGRVFQVLEPVTGESANGPWKKVDFVIETMDQYPKKICFTVWNDKIETGSLVEGSVIGVHFNAESRENNGRWYTGLTAWKIDSNSTAPTTGYVKPEMATAAVEAPAEDNLPF